MSMPEGAAPTDRRLGARVPPAPDSIRFRTDGCRRTSFCIVARFDGSCRGRSCSGCATAVGLPPGPEIASSNGEGIATCDSAEEMLFVNSGVNCAPSPEHDPDAPTY